MKRIILALVLAFATVGAVGCEGGGDRQPPTVPGY